MNNRRRDTLLNAAFDRETNVETLTGEERTELARLSSMKDALVGLKNVPECQLSSDRLRNAILDKGVKRKSPIGWTALVATAACAVVAVLVVNQTRINKPTPVAIGESNKPVVESLVTEPFVAVLKTDVTDSIVVMPDNHTPKTIKRAKSSSRSKDATMTVAMKANEIDPAVEMISVGLIAQPTNQGNSVVVVDSAYKADTGAYEAVELEAFGDVVFGG